MPNKTNLAYAAKIRQQRIDALKFGLTDSGLHAPTFFDAAATYMLSLDVARSTAMTYKGLLEKYWVPAFGNTPVNRIPYSKILATVNSIEWPSGKTRKNAIIPLRGVFDIQVHDGVIASNPVSQLRQTKHQKPPVDPILPEEWQAIRQHLDGDALDYFSLAWETGMRHPGEIIALDWADFRGDRLTVNKAIVRRRVKPTKNYEAREVLLTTDAQKILRNRSTRFAGGPIFTNTQGGHWCDGDWMNLRWQKACRLAKVRYRRAYNLRHGFASRALTAGLNPAFVASQLGHSLEMTLNVYGKYITSGRDRSEIEKLERWAKGGHGVP